MARAITSEWESGLVLDAKVPDRTSLNIHWEAATWVYEAGDEELAVEWINSTADRAAADLAPNDELALELRLDAIVKESDTNTRHQSLFPLGYAEDVRDRIERLATDAVSALGAYHRVSLTTRFRLFQWEEWTKRDWSYLVAELPDWDDLVLLLTQHLGPIDPLTLTARHGYARHRKLTGEAKVQKLKELEDTYLKIDGHASLNVLGLRIDRAQEMQFKGDQSEAAFRLLETVITELKGLVGKRHPETISARSVQLNGFVNAAGSAKEAGALRAALQAGKALHRDAVEWLGKEHFEVLQISNSISQAELQLRFLDSELLEERLGDVTLGLLNHRAGDANTFELAWTTYGLEGVLDALLQLTVAALARDTSALAEVMEASGAAPLWLYDAINVSDSRGVHPDEFMGIFLKHYRQQAVELISNANGPDRDQHLLDEANRAIIGVDALFAHILDGPIEVGEILALSVRTEAFFGIWGIYNYMIEEIAKTSGLSIHDSAEQTLKLALEAADSDDEAAEPDSAD